MVYLYSYDKKNCKFRKIEILRVYTDSDRQAQLELLEDEEQKKKIKKIPEYMKKVEKEEPLFPETEE